MDGKGWPQNRDDFSFIVVSKIWINVGNNRLAKKKYVKNVCFFYNNQKRNMHIDQIVFAAKMWITFNGRHRYSQRAQHKYRPGRWRQNAGGAVLRARTQAKPGGRRIKQIDLSRSGRALTPLGCDPHTRLCIRSCMVSSAHTITEFDWDALTHTREPAFSE